MKCFEWQYEYSRSFGKIKRPLAEISLKGASGEWQPLFVYVDSGADVTIIKKSFADLLGIDFKKGKYTEFGGVSGDKIETFIHKIDLKIGHYTIRQVDIAFCADDIPPNLLGRRGIFDVMDVYFKCIDEATCFLKRKTGA